MKNPKFSILLPTFARAKDGFLGRAIESILNQDYQDFELIICDDGSTDGSKEIIEQYARSDERVIHQRFEKNIGLPALTLAHAYVKSRGEYLAFCFDDCEFAPTHLSAHREAFESDPGVMMAYSNSVAHTQNGSIILGKKFDYNELTKFNYISNSAVVLKKDIINKVGWYDPHVILKRVCDWDLWIRIGKSYKIKHINKITTEENGAKLKDSLGNSNTIDHEIVQKYMQRERDKYLMPSMLIQQLYNPFFADENYFSPDESERIFYLSMEHVSKTKSLDTLMRIVCDKTCYANNKTEKKFGSAGEDDGIKTGKYPHELLVDAIGFQFEFLRKNNDKLRAELMVANSLCEERLNLINDMKKGIIGMGQRIIKKRLKKARKYLLSKK